MTPTHRRAAEKVLDDLRRRKVTEIEYIAACENGATLIDRLLLALAEALETQQQEGNMTSTLSGASPEKDRPWLPTQSGTGFAWLPEWRGKTKDGWSEWLRVPVVRGTHDKPGVPGPLIDGGVIDQIGLMGYEQAMALAWQWSAIAAADGNEIEVRAAKYDLEYEIKARSVVDAPGQSPDRVEAELPAAENSGSTTRRTT